MGINEFIEKLAEALDDMDVSGLLPETKFRELDEWSSLAALSIIAMVDDEYELELSGAELRSVETIQELFNLVQSKL